MISEPAFQIGLGLAGACVGSFVTTAALRTARAQQFLNGRSACDGCGLPLGFRQTVPVFGYMRARGACSSCGTAIDPAHLAGELLCAGVVVTAAAFLPPVSASLVVAVGFVLLGAAVFDARTRRLPNGLTALVAALGAVLAWTHGQLLVGAGSAVVTFLVLEGLRRGFLRFRGTPGLGFGDVKLLAAAAIWLGTATPWAVVVASVLGLAGFAMLKSPDGRLPFGPAIALAVWILGTLKEAGAWPV